MITTIDNSINAVKINFSRLDLTLNVKFQVTVVVLSVIIFAILGELYTERGSMLSTAIFVYAITSPINGYAGGGLYARMGGRVWIKQMLLSAFMIPALVCGTAFFINFIAMYYHASRAIPFGSMVSI